MQFLNLFATRSNFYRLRHFATTAHFTRNFRRWFLEYVD
jgi:hypothetical protein